MLVDVESTGKQWIVGFVCKHSAAPGSSSVPFRVSRVQLSSKHQESQTLELIAEGGVSSSHSNLSQEGRGYSLGCGLWAVLIPSGEELGTFPRNPHSAGLCRQLALLPVPTVVTQAITRTLPAASNVTNTPKFSSHLSLHRRPSQPHTDPQTAPALSDFLRSPTAHQKSLEPVHRTSSRTL